MRLLLISFLLFILWGCSTGESARLVEPSRTPVAENSMPASIVVNAQTPIVAENNEKTVVIKGGEICEEYLLKKIAKEKAEGSRMVKLKSFNIDDETLSSNIKKWLETKDEEKLTAFELSNKDKKALILGSWNMAATGIASNFQNWYIHSDTYQTKFLSLSEDPRLIFWDKNGMLNYYSVTYGSKFLENKDWENLTLNLLQYKISPDGESQLVSEERNVKCK